uniref:Uncharacterized protein n=1 Tax=Solanum tuberosum TaxID=4113 RepID=M1BPH9_SOLTU
MEHKETCGIGIVAVLAKLRKFRRNVRMITLTKQMVNTCRIKHGLHGGHVAPHPS